MTNLSSSIALIVLLAGCGTSVRADTITPLSDAELADQVGGMRTPSGIDFTFGAVVRTYVDGQLALQTHLTWTDTGATEVADVGDLSSNLARDAAAAGVSLGDIAGLGVVVPGSGGSTVVLHDLDSGHIASLVFNTGDNRAITQDTAITLNLPNLQQYQSDTVRQQMQLNLQDTVSRALQAAQR